MTPSVAPMVKMMTTAMTVMMMPLRVRYHGTLATMDPWTFAADSSL